MVAVSLKKNPPGKKRGGAGRGRREGSGGGRWGGGGGEARAPPQSPSVLVVGAGGRSGRGALDMIDLVNAELGPSRAVRVTKWDRQETSRGGPFWELLEQDVVINCIYLGGPAGEFLHTSMLDVPYSPRRLTTFGDVSCDVASPFSPFPFSNATTTVFHPVRRVQEAYFKQQPRSLDVIAIDHLPSLLPRDASENFSAQLLPHLVELDRTDVWKRARALFQSKSAEAKAKK